MALGLGAGLAAFMVRMPGRSHAGPLPPLAPAEAEVAGNLRRYVTALARDIGERNLEWPDRLRAAADLAQRELVAQGWQVSSQAFTARGESVVNLEVEGPGATRELVVVGAHYDSVSGSCGADDNASGVAAVLELARLLEGRRFRRGLRLVLFANEEPPYFKTGEMGSLVYARRCRERREAITAMLSLETLGYYTSAPGSQRYPWPLSLIYPDRGDFVAFVSDLGSARLLRRALGSFRSHTAFPAEGAALPSWVEGVSWSDHWSFAYQGYPALMVTDTALFRYPQYHSAEDTPDRLDYERTARVVLGLSRVVTELLDEP